MEEIKAKKWLKVFFGIFFISAIIISLLTYSVDPFFYSSYQNENKLLNPRLVNKGLIDNFDYDTVIIGSSMVQNFDVNYLNKKMNSKVVKLTIGGMTLSESLMLYRLVEEKAKASTYILNIDLTQFASYDDLETESLKFPAYLYNSHKIDDIKYLLGYEAVFRYVPADLALTLLDQLNYKLPSGLLASTDVNKFVDWSDDYSYSLDVVKNKYLSGKYNVSSIDLENIESRMQNKINDYLNIIIKDKKVKDEIIFGFPPYSALFWYNAKSNGYYDSLLNAKSYFINKCAEVEGIRIVDLQSIDDVLDLSNYRDITHFSPNIQKKYADAIITGEYDLDKSQTYDATNNINQIIISFENKGYDWLN